MHNRLNKTTICCVLCVDIVGHSRKPDADQIRQKEHFNALVEAAFADPAARFVLLQASRRWPVEPLVPLIRQRLQQAAARL